MIGVLVDCVVVIGEFVLVLVLFGGVYYIIFWIVVGEFVFLFVVLILD